MSEEQKPEEGLSQSDINEITQELDRMDKALVSEATQKKIEEEKAKAKEEARKEMEKEKEYEELKKANEELQNKIEEQEKSAAKQLEEMKNKIDDMVTSKANVNVQNPFDNSQNQQVKQNQVDTWSDDEVKNFEDKSAEAFFGEDYLRMKRD